MMKSMAKNLFNIDIAEDADISTLDKFKAHMEEKMHGASDADAGQTITEAAKKTKRQLAMEAQKQQEGAMANKSVQEIYHKLVAALHPAREQDENERGRKTELMQRINIAYGKKDVLGLLALQLEAEQIDASHIKQMAEAI